MCPTSYSVTMSTLLHSICSANFIVASFLEAAHVAEYQHQWMTADTWAELIKQRFKLEERSLTFTGNDLVNAFKGPPKQLAVVNIVFEFLIVEEFDERFDIRGLKVHVNDFFLSIKAVLS